MQFDAETFTFEPGKQNMASTKEEMIKIIEQQPEDSTFDEILRELAFAKMVEQGLADSDGGRTFRNEDIRRRIRSWQK